MEVFYFIGIVFYYVGGLIWRASTPLKHWQDKTDIYLFVIFTPFISLVWPIALFVIGIVGMISYFNKGYKDET